MPVSMYQSFTFFNLTNWNQVKSIGQKPRFVEVGPYVYKTVWSKADINFFDDDKQVSYGEKKQWHFQAHLSNGNEDDLIWTINTPLMTALALIQNAPVITRNIVSVILDGLGEGAFIKRPIRSLLFEGYSDLIVSVGPLFDRRFANFNGKFAYLYNKNDTIDGHWTVSTGVGDLNDLNKINRFQSNIVNITSSASGSLPQGLNEVKAECAQAWALDQSTNGQLFAPFNRDIEQIKLQQQLQQLLSKSSKTNDQLAVSASQHQHQHQNQQQQQQQQHQHQHLTSSTTGRPSIESSIVQAPKRFFSRISGSAFSANSNSPSSQPATNAISIQHELYINQQLQQSLQDKLNNLKDLGKFIFYPDLCRPIHLLPSKQPVVSGDGIEASRYYIDPRVFMNSSQVPSNKCYEMNPRPPLANALAATISSVTGANVNVPNLVPSGSSPFTLFIPPTQNHHHHHYHNPLHGGLFGSGGQQHQHSGHENGQGLGAGLFERSNLVPSGSFLNNALQTLSATANQAADQLAASSSHNINQQANSPIGRLGRVRQLFSNIVSQRMSGASPLLPSLSNGPGSLLMGAGQSHHGHSLNPFSSQPASMQQTQARNEQFLHQTPMNAFSLRQNALSRQASAPLEQSLQSPSNVPTNSSSDELNHLMGNPALQPNQPPVFPTENQLNHVPNVVPPIGLQAPIGGPSDRWVTQFRFKWPRGVFSIGQCQLGAPIYVSLPHFLDADEYYLEQVDGLKPNKSLHSFYIDVESTLHSVPVNARARLQLNVATPELRFRNIPNAMIPVLWQEVSFKIDRPVATMLYWSFTMSSTIYKTISVLLIISGVGLLIFSLVSTLRRNRIQCDLAPQAPTHRRAHSISGQSNYRSNQKTNLRGSLGGSSASSRRTSSSSYSRRAASPHLQHRRLVASPEASSPNPDTDYDTRSNINGNNIKDSNNNIEASIQGKRSSSWQHVMMTGGNGNYNDCVPSEPLRTRNLRANKIMTVGVKNMAFVCNSDDLALSSSEDRQSSSESFGESCCSGVGRRRILSSPRRANDWSRASSHCELVSSYGIPKTPTSLMVSRETTKAPVCSMTTMKPASKGCIPETNLNTSCLLTCLRHSSHCSSNINQPIDESSKIHKQSLIDNLKQQFQESQPLESLTNTTSDIDTKVTTLSSSSRSLSNSIGSGCSINYGSQKDPTINASLDTSRKLT